jgi:hypothetical protein
MYRIRPTKKPRRTLSGRTHKRKMEMNIFDSNEFDFGQLIEWAGDSHNRMTDGATTPRL